jgi:SseB protein C-terminal domain
VEDSSGFTTATGTPIESLDQSSIPMEIVGEQSGRVEDEFKNAVRPILGKDSSIRAAYLVRLRYGEEEGLNVGLCLVCKDANPDRATIASIGDAFYRTFSSSEHLDIIPVELQEEPSLAETCAPFYKAQ